MNRVRKLLLLRLSNRYFRRNFYLHSAKADAVLQLLDSKFSHIENWDATFAPLVTFPGRLIIVILTLDQKFNPLSNSSRSG